MAMAKLEAVNLMLDAIGEAPDSITQVGPTQVAFDTSFFNLKFHQVIFIKRKSSGASAQRRRQHKKHRQTRACPETNW